MSAPIGVPVGSRVLVETTCSNCEGKGWVPDKDKAKKGHVWDCPTCAGKKVTRHAVTLGELRDALMWAHSEAAATGLQPPARCTGEWSAPVDLTHGMLQPTGRCGICQQTVETMHSPLGTFIAAHPYLLPVTT